MKRNKRLGLLAQNRKIQISSKLFSLSIPDRKNQLSSASPPKVSINSCDIPMNHKKSRLTKMIKVKGVKAVAEVKNPNKRKWLALRTQRKRVSRKVNQKYLRILWQKATSLMAYQSATMKYWILMMIWTFSLAFRNKNL